MQSCNAEKADTYSIARELSKDIYKISVCRFLPSKRYMHTIATDRAFINQRFEYLKKKNIEEEFDVCEETHHFTIGEERQ